MIKKVVMIIFLTTFLNTGLVIPDDKWHVDLSYIKITEQNKYGCIYNTKQDEIDSIIKLMRLINYVFAQEKYYKKQLQSK